MLTQYIYTSVLVSELSPKGAYDISAMSVKICQKFGITGRVFANCQQALAITEGPKDVVEHYFHSVSQDPMSGTIIPHVQRSIEAREFVDYSVWLNLRGNFHYDKDIRKLTPQTLQMAWPSTLSARMRIMTEVYLDPDVAAA